MQWWKYIFKESATGRKYPFRGNIGRLNNSRVRKKMHDKFTIPHGWTPWTNKTHLQWLRRACIDYAFQLNKKKFEERRKTGK